MKRVISCLILCGLFLIPMNLFTLNAAPSKDTSVSIMAAAKKYTICVRDSNGAPIIGATIMVKGTNTGTSTDVNGNAILWAAEGKKIEISYIGYKTVVYLLSSSSTIIVIMEEDTEK